MDQASASSAASCARNPVAPRTSSSCSRSADRSQTGVPPPARLGPQSEPHAEPSNRDPSPSSPPSADSRLRAISCRSFTPAKPDNPAASLRDYCSGAYNLDGRDQEGCPRRLRNLRRNLGRQIREGGRVLDQGSRCIAGLLLWVEQKAETSKRRHGFPKELHSLSRQ